MGIIKTETFFNEDGIERRIDTYENGMTIEYDAVEPESTEPELTPDPVMEKLNAMEEKLNALTADSVTVANVETAILEGVNEV